MTFVLYCGAGATDEAAIHETEIVSQHGDVWTVWDVTGVPRAADWRRLAERIDALPAGRHAAYRLDCPACDLSGLACVVQAILDAEQRRSLVFAYVIRALGGTFLAAIYPAITFISPIGRLGGLKAEQLGEREGELIGDLLTLLVIDRLKRIGVPETDRVIARLANGGEFGAEESELLGLAIVARDLAAVLPPGRR